MVNEAAADSTRPDIASIFLSLMKAHGRSALERTLAGVGGKLPRSNLGYLAELLLAFSKRIPNETRAWLKELLAQVSKLSSSSTALQCADSGALVRTVFHRDESRKSRMTDTPRRS